MKVTDLFASTVVVTIPVLLLAATVELRSFADTAAQRAVGWQEEFVLRNFDFVKLLAETRRQTGWAKIIALFPVMDRLMKLIPGIGFWIWLPIAWLAALVLSAISEVYSLLYLAGIHKDSAPAQLSVIAITALVALLIITPAFQTFIVAPWIGIHQYIEKARKLDLDPEMLEAAADAIPALVELKLINARLGREMAEAVRSHLARTSSEARTDSDRQARWRSSANTGLRPYSRRPPRWLLQRAARGTSYSDSKINEIDWRGYHSR